MIVNLSGDQDGSLRCAGGAAGRQRQGSGFSGGAGRSRSQKARGYKIHLSIKYFVGIRAGPKHNRLIHLHIGNVFFVDGDLRRYRSQVENLGDQVSFFHQLMRQLLQLERGRGHDAVGGAVDHQHATLLPQVALVGFELFDLRARRFDVFGARAAEKQIELVLGYGEIVAGRALQSSRILVLLARNKIFIKHFFDHGQPDLRVLEVVLRLGDVGFSDFDFVGRGTRYLHFEFGARFRKLRFGFFKSGARINVRELRNGLSFVDVIAFVHVDFIDHAIHGRAHIGVLDGQNVEWPTDS